MIAKGHKRPYKSRPSRIKYSGTTQRERTQQAMIAFKAKRVTEAKAFIAAYKKNHPRSDCDVVFPPVCMEFDHTDPSTKVKAVSNMVSGGYDLTQIIIEVSKCDLVCANCHRIRHHGR